MRKLPYFFIAGFCAGALNGLLGAGGGLILVPILSRYTDLDEQELFPCSLSIMIPICVISLLWSADSLEFSAALPYLIGSVIGGVAAGLWSKYIPTKWLHRTLGVMILWGGFRYLCS